MAQNDYIAPECKKDSFHCPLCNVYSHQIWMDAKTNEHFSKHINGLDLSFCAHCKKCSYWIDKKLIFPKTVTAPLAHKDMPASVKEYYDEARQISNDSPRASAALLRIAAKKLCEFLGEKNEPDLYKAIGKLKKKGLSNQVIQSLDTVRIVGNEGGAHEGLIDLTNKDNEEVVNKLFWLVNYIVEKVITEPTEVNDMFISMPEGKKQSVKERDEEQ